jgi:RNA recognition motif-containing protein
MSNREPRPFPPRVRRDTSSNPPIHTVFLRSLASEVTDSEIANLAAEFGPTLCIFSFASKRGIAFITFYDLRHAQACVSALENRVLHGRTIHASFANTISDNSREDPVPACATITCRAEKVSTRLSDQEINAEFSRYGDIRQNLQCQNSNSVIVQYFDLRAARRAVEESGKIEIHGDRIFTEFNPEADGEHLDVRARERHDRDNRFERPLPDDGILEPSRYPAQSAYPQPPGFMSQAYPIPPPMYPPPLYQTPGQPTYPYQPMYPGMPQFGLTGYPFGTVGQPFGFTIGEGGLGGPFMPQEGGQTIQGQPFTGVGTTMQAFPQQPTQFGASVYPVVQPGSNGMAENPIQGGLFNLEQKLPRS